MNYKLLFIGFVFLFNPTVNVIDILPDFIGYLLIAKGLYEASYFIDRFSDVRRNCTRLAIITAARLLSCAFLPAVDSTFRLVLTFGFAAIELIYLIPTVKLFFDGVDYAGMRFGGEFDYSNSPLCTYTVVYMIMKLSLAALPYVTSLQLYDKLGVVSATSLDYSSFTTAFVVLSVIILLPFGIVWFVRMNKYFRALSRDRTFSENIRRKFREEFAPNTNLFLSERMTQSLTLVFISVLLCFNLTVNYINFLPSFLCCAALLTVFILLLKLSRAAIAGIVLSLIWASLSVTGFVMQLEYVKMNFTPAQSMYIARASEMYETYSLVAYAESALFLATFAVLFALLFKLVGAHIDKLYDVLRYNSADKKKTVVKSLRIRFIFICVFGVLTVAATAFLPYVAVRTDDFPAYGFITACITAAFAISVFTANTVLNESVYSLLRDKWQDRPMSKL